MTAPNSDGRSGTLKRGIAGITHHTIGIKYYLELNTCTCSIDDFKRSTDRNRSAKTSYVGGRYIDDHEKEGNERDLMASLTSPASRDWQRENEKSRSPKAMAKCDHPTEQHRCRKRHGGEAWSCTAVQSVFLGLGLQSSRINVATKSCDQRSPSPLVTKGTSSGRALKSFIQAACFSGASRDMRFQCLRTRLL
jgi:hypothetical protein